MTFFAVFSAVLPLSLNCALGVKVDLRAAVFYGFLYKLRPKPKIAFARCAQLNSCKYQIILLGGPGVVVHIDKSLFRYKPEVHWAYAD